MYLEFKVIMVQQVIEQLTRLLVILKLFQMKKILKYLVCMKMQILHMPEKNLVKCFCDFSIYNLELLLQKQMKSRNYN